MIISSFENKCKNETYCDIQCGLLFIPIELHFTMGIQKEFWLPMILHILVLYLRYSEKITKFLTTIVISIGSIISMFKNSQ